MIYVVSVRVHAQDRFERGKKKKTMDRTLWPARYRDVGVAAYAVS